MSGDNQEEDETHQRKIDDLEITIKTLSNSLNEQGRLFLKMEEENKALNHKFELLVEMALFSDSLFKHEDFKELFERRLGS